MIRKEEVGKAAPGSAARTQGAHTHTHTLTARSQWSGAVLTEIFHQEGEEAWVGQEEGLSGRSVRGPSGLPSPRPSGAPPYPGHSPAPASPYSSSRGAAPQRHVQALPTPRRSQRERPPHSGLLSPTQTTGRAASLARAGDTTSSLRDDSDPGLAFRPQTRRGGLARTEASMRARAGHDRARGR